ncbi:DMT family transporter [Saccharothrix algeriensis]|uniref:DMT family transporter n=1 Tax=Saccharothrix algeriensis TaxID=173560 RepID=A0A8T8HY79_9PSEU|nr:DMT family transporter [Saccharothrix algeriensis]MBM7809183.1 drug/metabolite transporter (DMT)-like permease [Saccharothrix algeriensis]QTR03545.1 DMT family transporter [Saccharothrix algeriensis]
MGLLALLWGSCFLWIELALTGLAPVQIAVVRCALGAAVLLGLALVRRQRLPRDRGTWARLAVAALFCNALPFVLFGIGQQSVDSGVAGVLNATTPLWSLLIGLLLGTERGPTPRRVGGLVLGFAGVLVIFAPWQRHGLASWGALALLGAAASYAVAFAYMGRELVGRGGPVAISAAQLAAATGLSALALPASPPAHLNATAVVAVVVLGVFGTGATFVLNYRIIEDEGATSAATVGYLLPVVSLALGALVLDEPLTPGVVAGMAVVLVGVALTRPARRAAGRDRRPPAEQRAGG